MAMIKININDLERLITDLDKAMSYIENDKSNTDKIFKQLVSNFPSDNHIDELSFKVENELKRMEELSSLLKEASVYLKLDTYSKSEPLCPKQRNTIKTLFIGFLV